MKSVAFGPSRLSLREKAATPLPNTLAIGICVYPFGAERAAGLIEPAMAARTAAIAEKRPIFAPRSAPFTNVVLNPIALLDVQIFRHHGHEERATSSRTPPRANSSTPEMMCSTNSSAERGSSADIAACRLPRSSDATPSTPNSRPRRVGAASRQTRR